MSKRLRLSAAVSVLMMASYVLLGVGIADISHEPRDAATVLPASVYAPS